MSTRSVIFACTLGTIAACSVPDIHFSDAGGGGGSDGSIGPQGVAVELIAGDISGPGNLDGSGSDAHFTQVGHGAFGPDGKLYVPDSNNTSIRIVSRSGQVQTLDLTVSSPFSDISALAVNGSGDLYVVDRGDDVIWKVSAGTPQLFFGTAGSAGNDLLHLDAPEDIALGSNGNLYVSDAHNNRVLTIPQQGSATLLAGGTEGSDDGHGFAARFSSPSGLAFGSDGALYVADAGNDTIRRITLAGDTTTVAGVAGVVGDDNSPTATTSTFNGPRGIAFDNTTGNFVIADAGNGELRLYSPGLNKVALIPSGIPFISMTALTADLGAIYIADSSALRMLDAGHNVSPFVGSIQDFESKNGSGADARFNAPQGVCVSGSTIYVTDAGTALREVTAAGIVITKAISSDHPFSSLFGIVADPTGALYAADAGANNIRFIQGATATVFAGEVDGTAGSRDGDALGSAQFFAPGGIALAGSDVFVADSSNNEIRRISGGQVSVFGSQTSLSAPVGIAVGSDGLVYVGDAGDAAVFQFAPDGAGSAMVFGTPGTAGSADGDPTTATFSSPQGLAIDLHGNVYVADNSGHTIRKITPAGQVSTIVGNADEGGIRLGAGGRLAAPIALAILGTDLLIVDTNALLVVRDVVTP